MVLESRNAVELEDTKTTSAGKLKKEGKEKSAEKMQAESAPDVGSTMIEARKKSKLFGGPVAASYSSPVGDKFSTDLSKRNRNSDSEPSTAKSPKPISVSNVINTPLGQKLLFLISQEENIEQMKPSEVAKFSPKGTKVNYKHFSLLESPS